MNMYKCTLALASTVSMLLCHAMITLTWSTGTYLVYGKRKIICYLFQVVDYNLQLKTNSESLNIRQSVLVIILIMHTHTCIR